MQQYVCLILAGISLSACGADSIDAAAHQSAPAAAASGCIAGGGGFLRARLRGELAADLEWSNEQLQCEGGARPDGKGLRVTLAGPLPPSRPGDAPRQLRFIFGIDLQDSAAGSAQALPTNVTVILEGEGRMFATRGAERCAVETLRRAPLAAQSGAYERVHVRGYCTEPAAELVGDARVLLPTFEFTGRVATGEAP